VLNKHGLKRAQFKIKYGEKFMKERKDKVNRIVLLSLVSLITVTSTASAEKYFTMKDGKLERPTGYREWIYVGTPLTPNDMNNGKATFPEFHHVYVDPDSWAEYKKTGTFPDGTITIKEMTSVGSKTAVSGNGYFSGEFAGLEATIKSKKYFSKEPGNWAFFSFSTPDHKTIMKTAAVKPAAECNACHAASAADDFVFTQYYPVLKFGKGKGEAATGGFQDTLEPAPY
jgi:hypothetical protein